MRLAIVAIAALWATACERPAENRQAERTGPTTDTPAAAAPATNTGKNERDRDPGRLTPEDQGGSEGDRELTQQVRQGVVKNDALSTLGKNVKIITREGVVTLRGPVKTAAEKSQIGAIATETKGVKRVENQLEIAAN
jgi:osmotically-inducible protein OsmY